MHDWREDVRSRLAAARLHPQDDADIADELAQHLEEAYAELAPRIGPGPARERLLAELKDYSLDDAIVRRRRLAPPSRSRVSTSSSIWRDVRYGLRSLRRSPGVLAAGTAALALGIG